MTCAISGGTASRTYALTVTREVLGQTVQSFLPSWNGGRDGAFSGTWKRQSGEDLKGRFVIQCKFTGKSDYVIKVSDLTDEVEKVKRLVRKKRCDIYVLITNAGLCGTGDEEIETLFKNAGAKHVLTLGADWLSQQIRENKRLRMSVPSVYGLGDLSQILDERPLFFYCSYRHRYRPVASLISPGCIEDAPTGRAHLGRLRVRVQTMARSLKESRSWVAH